MALTKRWAGKVFGTNVGNVYVDMEGADDALIGILRFNDEAQGIVVFKTEGVFDGAQLVLKAVPTQVPPGTNAGDIALTGKLMPTGTLEGTWVSTAGTGGTFILYPHGAIASPGPNPPPEQLYTAQRSIGAVRLYPDDVRQLIDFIGRDFSSARVVATYRERGSEVSRYADDFMKDFDRIGRLDYLKLGLGEPDAFGLNRNAFVELSAVGPNEVKVQAVQEAWALGKAEAIAGLLRRHQKFFVTGVRQFGLNAGGLALVVVLTFLPELPLVRRAVFLVVALGLAWGVKLLHDRFIPNAAIFLTGRTPGLLQRAWPQVLSWIIAVTSGVAAAVVYGLLKGELVLHNLFPFLH